MIWGTSWDTAEGERTVGAVASALACAAPSIRISISAQLEENVTASNGVGLSDSVLWAVRGVQHAWFEEAH